MNAYCAGTKQLIALRYICHLVVAGIGLLQDERRVGEKKKKKRKEQGEENWGDCKSYSAPSFIGVCNCDGLNENQYSL